MNLYQAMMIEKARYASPAEGPAPSEWENWTELERTATRAYVFQSNSTGSNDAGSYYRLDVHNRAEFVRAARECHLCRPHDGEVSTWVTELII